jgi:Amt family ammonium transporter
MLGLFATKAVNPGVITEGWLVGGSPTFFTIQILSMLLVCAYCFLFTLGMLHVINFITPVKVTKEEEIAGLDNSLHGEIAYEQD